MVSPIRLVALALGVLTVVPMTAAPAGDAQRSTRSSRGRSVMDSVAQQYVRLVLAVGQHDPDYVDAYYGPPEWKQEADSSKLELTAIADRAGQLRKELQGARPGTTGPDAELSRLRFDYLDRQLS
jgi:hypothetical protein